MAAPALRRTRGGPLREPAAPACDGCCAGLLCWLLLPLPPSPSPPPPLPLLPLLLPLLLLLLEPADCRRGPPAAPALLPPLPRPAARSGSSAVRGSCSQATAITSGLRLLNQRAAFWTDSITSPSTWLSEALAGRRLTAAFTACCCRGCVRLVDCWTSGNTDSNKNCHLASAGQDA